MPELPEVQTIVDDLTKKVIGSQIMQVLSNGEGQEIVNQLPGEMISSVERKAKYLIFNLVSGKKLIFHLKLTGRILVRNFSYPADEFTRLVIKLSDNQEIRFTDRNGYASVWLVNNIDEVDSNLGPDPFEVSNKAFNLAFSKSGKGTIKETLLDQKTISGVGNIYADEALYLAQINPFRAPKSLSLNETTKLLESIKTVLQEGIKHRGTTIDSYRDTSGRPGTHQFHLLVYGKAGKACRRCATKIEYTEIKGRRTHFCPNCQPKEQLSLF